MDTAALPVRDLSKAGCLPPTPAPTVSLLYIWIALASAAMKAKFKKHKQLSLNTFDLIKAWIKLALSDLILNCFFLHFAVRILPHFSHANLWVLILIVWVCLSTFGMNLFVKILVLWKKNLCIYLLCEYVCVCMYVYYHLCIYIS